VSDGPILVIDDSLTIRRLLEMALGKAGLPLETAALGRDGLALAKRLHPRLILLDYVLPDVKGSEVCALLAQDAETAAIPIVVMSAKSDDIRPLFKHQRAVVEFIAKPFSPAEITHLVEQVLGRIASAAAQGAPAVPGDDGAHRPITTRSERIAGSPRELAARLAFNVLRERLTRIPEWCGELGAQTPAPFFARKLLTPEVVGNLLDGLARLTPATAVTPAEHPGEASPFTGSTAFLAPTQLLRLLADGQRSGELRLHGDTDLSLYFERGDLVLALARDAESARRMLATFCDPSAASLGPGDFQRLVDEARRSEAPVLALVAAQGLLGTDAAATLHRHGRQALRQALARGPLTFAWSDRPLPAFVAALARPIIPEQLMLERLREVDDWSQIELQVTSLDQVCVRAEGFRARLARFELDDLERRVLLQVNGRHQVKDLVQRCGLSTFEVFHILYRLIQVRLIKTPSADDAMATGEATDALLLCDEDDVGMRQPLARWLARRPGAPALLAAEPAQLLERIVATMPRLTLVAIPQADPGHVGPDEAAIGLAQAVRGRLEISDARLVAVLERWDRRQARDLEAAGFDAVLAKPVHLTAIARLMSA
jgi:CheY-like chemotaxis protein